MKLCSPYPKCDAVCDFCHYWERRPKYYVDYVPIGSDGYCHFHDEPRDLTDQCDEFWCFTLPFDGRKSFNPFIKQEETGVTDA